VLIAHLSDLHMRDAADVIWLERQLDRIGSRHVDHLAITGDLLDRWNPRLLSRALDALSARRWLEPERLTILHGNHDLASSGGHPRRGADLWRLATRFWDPPPLVAWRRRRFYRSIADRCAPPSGAECLVAHPAPFIKTLDDGARIAVVDTVALPRTPFTLRGGSITVHHAVGCIPRSQTDWLSALPPAGAPLIVLVHHLPLGTPGFTWTSNRSWGVRLPEFHVPMHVDEDDRARFWIAAGHASARLVLCGHVHRARLEWNDGIAVGVNGQSGAAWAGRTVAFYTVDTEGVTMTMERVD
jgi:3',5'-cyclic AMP phosphodiesterase CpdA